MPGTLLSAEEAASILQRHFEIEAAELHCIHGESAAIYRVAIRDSLLAFKAVAEDVANSGIFAWQGEVMAYVRRQFVPVPRLLTDIAGHLTCSTEQSGRSILVQVCEWLPGTPLINSKVTRELLYDVGLSAGKLRRALDKAPRPPRRTSHIWDARRTRETMAIFERQIEEGRVCSLVKDAVERFAREAEPLISRLPVAVVHQDLNDSNILVSADRFGCLRVSGILDFGDALVGLRVADLAVPAAYVARFSPEPDQAMLTVVRGWLSTATLDDVEARAILPLAIARLAVNIAVWTGRLSASHNDYAVLRVRGSIAALEALLEMRTDWFIEQISTAHLLNVQE